ncbi:serine hydrolase [uncultured Litoreibacter sp.]|uniref:serine hydrolase domain-containing protein n=1 Tax=uncultured Litoreibacter sp. TaxID=1392394 RepID=UPI002608C0EB|nr:serine hydrolase domain-containing protein [uncultured Litoreibacter sp.]
MRITCLIASLCLALPALAQGQDAVADRLEQAFRDWADTHDVARGALAATYQGNVVSQIGIGQPADTPMELASLSKAITGTCAMSLIAGGDWHEATTAADVLGQGPDVTVGQLMTHTSGYVNDATQMAMPAMLDAPDHPGIADALLELGPPGKAGTYVYSNENYAILGRMISVETGQTYGRACADRVLRPAGVKAEVSPRTGAFAAFGGWAMPVADYAKFHAHHFGEGSILGQAPEGAPMAEMGGGAFYGPGTIWRAFRGGHNFWHFGALCFPGRMNTGAFAVQWHGGWGVSVAYNACVDWPAMAELDGVLAAAVFGEQK